MLHPKLSERPTLEEILKHEWTSQRNHLLSEQLMCSDPRRLDALIGERPSNTNGHMAVSHTQPEFLQALRSQAIRPHFCFSQPENEADLTVKQMHALQTPFRTWKNLSSRKLP